MMTASVNFGPNGIEDMITLDNLTEENLLKNLKIRYDKNLIYTFMGSILVSVNPYKLLPIYTNEVVRKYVGKRLGLEPPHVFAIADAAYRHMREHTRNQGIIISGESGSGKTEATKLILQYFAAMTNRHTEIEQMILQSSPILEAFGNAKTVRNNNSSRFGKLIEIHFDNSGYIMGARITQYLLEKSRIPYQAANERNYHIFYQFLAGCTDEERARYKLKEASKFRYLNQSGCIEIPGMDDESNFNKTKIAMTFLGISEEAQAVLFSVLAAVLHVGNVEFRPEGEGSAIKNLDSVKAAAELLALKADDLARALVTRSLTVRGTTTVIPLNVQQASDTRDALAKAIYSRLFEWLVVRINKSIVKPNTKAFIAVLDIFGFENFKVNSFEQLCINYTNEKLQLHFNEHIFKIEQEEYAREKISWSKVDFKDNAECIALIERPGAPPGLIALLDEECRFPKATDATFLEKITAQHKDSKNFERAKNARTSFVVKHYAGDVAYEVKDFLDKNRDTMQPDLLAVINASKHDLVRAMFQNTVSADDTSKKNVTVGGNFRTQLVQLMQVLEATNTFYVRCVKPNMAQVSDMFDMDMVMAQLRYAGVLETVKIRKSGYPVRFSLQDFAQRFRLLCPAVGTSRDWKSNCDRILQSLPQLQQGAWQVGVTKVFLRDYTSAALEDMRNSRLLKQVIRIQSWWRMIVLRLFYLHARGACITIQRHVRGHQQRRRYKALRTATICIQAAARMIIVRPRQAERMRKKRDEIRRRMEEEKARKAAEEERRRREEEERRKQAKKDEEKAEKEREKQRKEDEKRRKEEEKKGIKSPPPPSSSERDRAVTSPQAPLSMSMPDESELRLPQGNARSAALSLTSVPSLTLDGVSPAELDIVSPGRLIKVALNKHKWVPFKQVNGIAEAPDLVTPEQIVIYPFMEYAQKNFRKGLQPKKSLVDTLTMRKRSATTGRGMDEMLAFQKKPLERPLLDRIPLNYMKVASEISVNIINYVTSLNKDPFVDVGAILRRGVATEQLRDEIYCQVVRQTYKPPSRDITARVWELLCFVCASFLPSQDLRKYIATFLLAHKMNGEDPQVRSMADFALRSLNRAAFREARRSYYRTSAPSQVELVALKQRAPIPVTVNLVDGRRFELMVDSATTANETIALLLKKLPLADASSFALYESFQYLAEPHTRLEKSLFIEELICDSLAKLDLVKATMSYALYFKRKMYLNPRAPAADPVERELLYHQAVYEVNEGTLPVSESDVCRMAALRVQHDLGDITSGKNFAVETYIPKHLIKKRVAGAWMQMVRMEYQHLAGTSKADAQTQLLTFASQLAFYGCTIFPVENTPGNTARLPPAFELMVNVDGLHFVRPENDVRTVFKTLFFTDVTVDYTMNSVKLVYQEGGQTSMTELTTKRGIEVYNLTQDYMYWLEAQSEWAAAKQDYEVNDATLLNFKKGELVHIVDKDVGPEWFMGEVGERHGLFPRSAVTVLLRPPPEVLEPPKEVEQPQRKKPENKLLNKLKGGPGPQQQQQGRNSNRMSAVLRPPSYQPGGGQRASIRVSQQSVPVRASQFVAAGRGQGVPANARTRWAAIEVDASQFPFAAFADRHFRRPEEHMAAAAAGGPPAGGSSLVNTLKRGGTILRKDAKPTATNMGELQMFSKDPLPAPLLASVKPELHKLAVECFRCVMKHMDDLPKGKAAPIEVVQFVVNSALANKELRDEIYCQVIKQCTNNPALESLQKGWVLLALLCGIFLPSDQLIKFVIAFLQENAKLAGIYNDIGNLAKLALEYVARVKENGGLVRQCPPSSQELDALSTGAQLGCVVFLPDKSSKTVDIDCATSVRELMLQLGELRELRGWAIFQTITAKNYYYSSVLKPTDNICDILFKWETFALPKGIEGDIDFQFAFKKHVFLKSDDDLTNPLAAGLLFHQIHEYVLKGRIKGQEDDYPLLAALAIAYEFGDYDPSKAQLAQNVLTDNPAGYLPSQLVKQFKLKKKDKAGERDTQLGSDGTQTLKIMNMAGRGGTMLKSSASSFVQRVQQLYATIQPGTTRPQLAARYINKCREFQFYGTSLFPVSYAVSRKDVRKVLLAVSEEGLQLFAGDAKPFRVIRLDEVASYGAAKGSISVTSGNLANPSLDTFVSEDADAIAEALAAYSKSKLEAQLIATRRKTMRPSFFN